jgi:hypothetical protein
MSESEASIEECCSYCFDYAVSIPNSDQWCSVLKCCQYPNQYGSNSDLGWCCCTFVIVRSNRRYGLCGVYVYLMYFCEYLTFLPKPAGTRNPPRNPPGASAGAVFHPWCGCGCHFPPGSFLRRVGFLINPPQTRPVAIPILTFKFHLRTSSETDKLCTLASR